MGEAKRRGSFEQRRRDAEEVRNAAIAERLAKEHQRKLKEAMVDSDSPQAGQSETTKKKVSTLLLTAAMAMAMNSIQK